MEYCRITLQFQTPVGTPLDSDTIFGHFAWGYRYLYGERKLQQLMEQFPTTPFAVFSSGFPVGYLPKPFFPLIIGDCAQLDRFKQLKKRRWVREEFIFREIGELTPEKLFSQLQRELEQQQQGGEVVMLVQRNSVNRLSNLVEEGLYTTPERFSNREYQVYCRVDLISREEVEEVFELISRLGYGRDRSVGKGRFRFQIQWDFPGKELFQPAEGRPYYLNLSNCFYNPENMHPLYGKTYTKFPKAGGINSNEPFKNPAIFYLPGSIFIVKPEGVVGKGENLYNRPHHYQNGFSIGLHFGGRIGVANG